MSTSTLLTRALLVDLDPPGVCEGSLRISEGRIVERIEGVPAVNGTENVVDLGGDLLVPGLVNAHTHLYSALVPGMAVPDVSGFDEALAQLDRHDMIYGETPESAYLRGKAHQGRGDREAAKAAFLKAPRLVADVAKYQREGARTWAMRARFAAWFS